MYDLRIGDVFCVLLCLPKMAGNNAQCTMRPTMRNAQCVCVMNNGRTATPYYHKLVTKV